MYFSGEYSKYNEGQQVYFKVPDSTLLLPCTINKIGILGSKLSEHTFLYNITCTDGKTYDCTEDALSVRGKTLHLVLKYEWYDKIKSGKKTEEYRKIKYTWFRRFCYFSEMEGYELELLMQYLEGPFSEFPVDLPYINRGGGYHKRIDSNGIPIKDISSAFKFCLAIAKYKEVVFHRGYTNETMTFDLNSLSIGKGNIKLGAPEGKNVFILKLGKRHD